MHFTIQKGTKITYGKQPGTIDHYYLDSGKLVIELNNGTTLHKSMKQLLEGYNEGTITFGDLPTATDPAVQAQKKIYIDMKLTDKQRDEVNHKKKYVESCLVNGWLLPADDCDLRIREHTVRENHGRCPTTRTVRAWAMRYLATNCDPRALLSRAASKGNRNPKLPETARNLMAVFVKTEYMDRKSSMLKTCDKLNAALRKNPAEYGTDSISYKAVRAYIAAIDAETKMRKRSGYKKARNEFPAGFHGEEPVYLLERVEIDQTQLNIYLVDEEGTVIGRPWLTMGIEVTSKMIPWFHLSMKRLDGSMLPRILYMAMRPKDMDSLRAKTPKLKSDWPVHGVFQEVVLDNSLENHTHDFQTACTDVLNIQLHYVPPGQGSLKPNIERMFGFIKSSFTTEFPGSYTKEDAEKHAQKHACLTMDELTQHFTRWVVDVYHNKFDDRLKMTPLKKWQDCIEKHGTTRLPARAKDFDQLLWRLKSGKLQKWGLQFSNLRYKSRDLMKLFKKYGEGYGLAFYFDPYNLSKIHVKQPNSDELIEAECSERGYRLNVVTYEEHQKVRRIVLDNKKLWKNDPESAHTIGLEILRGDADALHKKANAKVRRAKAKGRTKTSDHLMNGSTKPPKPKPPTLADFAPWLNDSAA